MTVTDAATSSAGTSIFDYNGNRLTTVVACCV